MPAPLIIPSAVDRPVRGAGLPGSMAGGMISYHLSPLTDRQAVADHPGAGAPAAGGGC